MTTKFALPRRLGIVDEVIDRLEATQTGEDRLPMLAHSHIVRWRPSVDDSQQGNAILVSWPGFSTKRLGVFTIK